MKTRLYVTWRAWKIDNVELEIINFVIKLGKKFTVAIYNDC